jgi:hypothetical protein
MASFKEEPWKPDAVDNEQSGKLLEAKTQVSIAEKALQKRTVVQARHEEKIGLMRDQVDSVLARYTALEAEGTGLTELLASKTTAGQESGINWKFAVYWPNHNEASSLFPTNVDEKGSLSVNISIGILVVLLAFC